MIEVVNIRKWTVKNKPCIHATVTINEDIYNIFEYLTDHDRCDRSNTAFNKVYKVSVPVTNYPYWHLALIKDSIDCKLRSERDVN